MTTVDHSPPSSHHQTTATDCCCAIVFVSCFVIIFIAVLVVLIIFDRTPSPKPIKPQFELERVGVEYLSYSVNGPTTASVSFAIRTVFMAENDRATIKYGVSSFNITYRGVNLDDAADFVRDASLNDRVELRIMGDVNAYIFIWTGWGTSTTTTPVSVDCVIAISPRKQALTSKLCGYDVLKLLYLNFRLLLRYRLHCALHLLFVFVRVPHQEPIKPGFELQQIGAEYLNYSVNGPTTASVSLAIRMVFMAENDNGAKILSANLPHLW
ncbi:hypothetical protein OSB04_030184 [Centaurea solstitialis]|uniref:Late embryogenesis abundant protein LEA-2 subgroup domain-containing protein n=1 Tax=Centaurea solstitialis TaxID=347529 RepID=A0AA38SK54_9ASTR|nr:hypothetical protein OSB04_030184 [Centaurea solstitialis]